MARAKSVSRSAVLPPRTCWPKPPHLPTASSPALPASKRHASLWPEDIDLTDHILIERPDAAPFVQVIRFNRPEKKNAFTRAMYQTMTDALRAANEASDIRVTAFLGSEGCFSAGNDLADFLAFATSGT